MYLVSLFTPIHTVGNVLGQQCPTNGNSHTFLGITSSYPVPLTNPFCIRCCFSGVCPPDVIWSLDDTSLTNGSINGNVLINSAAILILLNPSNVLSVGNILSCNSVSQDQYDITITEFSK